ncbi:histone-lysine N-methyltransferase SETMAR-like [Nylanderia fulva]|uniref:histone-lysine N-methyltransferase SETMAR-like n=1 Tax=Nylanderia fulva TaxID=613905 RepID=UPI0010FBA09F|nr:histone-lysine N-methyltransferase SETMAR-like [Nylanderia fulva]
MFSVYGYACVTHQTICKWYRRFEFGNFNMEDETRSGRSQEVDETLLKDFMHKNPRVTVRELADTLHKSIFTVHDHLKKLGFSTRLDKWLPHELNEWQLMERVNICDMLLQRHQKEPFLKRIVTGDESWILYNNVSRKRSWGIKSAPTQTVAEPRLHPKKFF